MAALTFLLAHLLFLHLLAGEPWLGVVFYRRLRAKLQVDPRARASYYRLLLAWEWAWMAVIAAILLGTNDPLGAIGLRPLDDLGFQLLAGIGAGVALTTAAMRLVPALRQNVQRQLAGSAALLPSRPAERWLFAAVATTAGICEEVLYRGFVWFYLSTTLPALPVWAIGAASALLFAVGHAYQGKAGIVQTGAAGAAFFALYALTGSLVPAIVLHALADLRVLALLPSREAAPTEAGRRV